jgi:hypothetical protein
MAQAATTMKREQAIGTSPQISGRMRYLRTSNNEVPLSPHRLTHAGRIFANWFSIFTFTALAFVFVAAEPKRKPQRQTRMVTK